jgi:methyl-accepting chemotaxis protein
VARRIQKLGLKGAIFGSFTIALLVILGTLFFLVPRQVESYLTGELERGGIAVARKIRERVQPHLREPAAVAATMEEITEGRTEIRAAAVIDSAGNTIASPRGARLERPIIERFLANVDQTRLPLPSGEWLVADRIGDPGAPTGYVLIVLDRRGVTEVTSQMQRIVAVAFVVGAILYIILVYLISRLFILRPLQSMMAVASRLSEADLTGRVEQTTDDELGSLAQALNRIGQALRDTLGRIRGVSEGVAQVIEQISRTGTAVSSGASTTQARVEETSSSMVQMLASLRGIAENVEVLYQSAEESSSSIMEMAATNDEVAENVQAMALSVEETTSAIEQMTSSIKEVNRNIEALLSSTAETSSSINEMDVSIGQVEMNANETAKLSELVSQDAETGVMAIHKTIAGIDKIKDSSRAASEVIETLGKRIQEIGNILNVIDDVAEQTNLLALNAAIIAAQAGEHGKGFAVVAEEIKELAERTGASTKEIADLIRGVQAESRNAVAAMNQGVRNVEEGVQLGREAEGALKKIFESANKATMMVKAIARATVEQSRGSKQVTGSVQRIAETVEQISKATNEQARGSEQIIKSAEKMKTITAHVQRSSQEQAHGSKQITKSIENINEMVTHLNRAQKEQTKGSEQVLKAVEAIKGVSEHQTRSVKQLEEAIESLQQQAEVLRAEVRRFRV